MNAEIETKEKRNPIIEVGGAEVNIFDLSDLFVQLKNASFDSLERIR